MDNDFGKPADRDEFDEFNEFDDDKPGLPWPPASSRYPPYPPPPASRRRRTRGVSLVVTGLVAGAVGFAVVAAVHEVKAGPAASDTPSSGASPAYTGGAVPGGGTGGGSATLLPPGTGGGAIPTTGPGQTVELEVGGKVTAVSATSITLGAGSHRVTAAVTKATVVTGKVHGIGGVKVGDLVSAQITGTDGKLTATAIQDPASLP